MSLDYTYVSRPLAPLKIPVIIENYISDDCKGYPVLNEAEKFTVGRVVILVFATKALLFLEGIAFTY